MHAPPYPIRPITGEEFDDWFRSAVVTFHGVARQEDAERKRAKTELDRTLAAYDGEQIVGTAGAYSFRMGVPGGLRPVAGVTEVTVTATHRRRGILRSLMQHQLADIHARGEALAALFASEASIYGRFGYGCAAREISLTLRRGESALIGETPPDEDLHVRVAAPGDVRKELSRTYEDVLVDRPGLFARDDAWWNSRLNDPEDRRHGEGPLQCVLVEDADRSRAYALFTVRARWDDDGIPDHRITVRELFGTDPAAYVAAWRHLLERDLVSSVIAQGRPADEPLLWLLADPRRARARVADNLWVRIVDMREALTQRAYSRPVDVVIDIDDDFCPWNAGRWRLCTGDGGATCERTADAPDLAMTARDLGAAYMGAAGLAAPARAGLVRELRPGAVHALSTALHWDPQPWCPMVF